MSDPLAKPKFMVEIETLRTQLTDALRQRDDLQQRNSHQASLLQDWRQRIQELIQESADRGTQITRVEAERDNAVAQGAVCMGALEPFAKEYTERFAGWDSSSDAFDAYEESSCPFTVGDLRRACQALSSIGPQATAMLKVVEARAPTEAMLNAARDWSLKKYGRGIGNDAAIGCWQAMHDALLTASTNPSPEKGTP